ncbi:hypothetical protein GCAAIG_07235 [Candidatus Electronema halotolerans]
MPEYAASSDELTGVSQRLAAHYTALAEKESARGAAGYARLDKERGKRSQGTAQTQLKSGICPLK